MLVREEIMEYVEELSRNRNEHIEALLISYFERENPDPKDVVLVEEHIGLKTIWYFSTKAEIE